ncbi:hypothetical protein ASG52_24980 [Methylobacterium sp. Leaf456]|uniref:hypothetical protein n=1 Tax=Methylobacterium sp. Leaf456 TaxID=1736382 RepID=UPI0006FA62F8|nr:hypothetical protein [Methylobacterium sp. Leaf456]KQT55068.1 hypothetical protein ASG52_24980 [Methylobacterium sp. Leaf456]
MSATGKDAGEPAETVTPTGDRGVSRRLLAIPVVLAAGWGALFSYTLLALTDDGREASARPARYASADPGGIDVPEVRLPEPERVPSPAAQQPRLLPVAAVTTAPEALAPPEPPRPAAPVLERAAYVGVWGPNAVACGQRQRRRGFLPATITEEGAKAGRTNCRFRNNRRDGAAWTMAADCSERGRRWTSQVRLLVEQDRLTWSSPKGLASYIRCGRKAG